MVNFFSLMAFSIALLQIKHYFCDFIFQNNYMAKGKASKKYLKPLLLHSCIHFVGMIICLLIICLMMGDFNTNLLNQSLPLILVLCSMDFVSHFVIDYFKAQHGEKDINNKVFWNELGLDQLCHGLVGTYIIFCLFTG